jgi:uncharacterized protein YcbX
MTATIQTLTHYPIKGLSGHDLADVTLQPNEGFPLDRVFGFARPDSGFDPANPVPLPKDKFHVLARDERLALLDTSYDPISETLTIKNGSKSEAFTISSEDGCAAASAYIRGYLALKETETPTLFAAHPHRFTDVSVTSAQMMNAISLVNQNSVDAFADQIGEPVDAARFRANIVFSGMDAYAELGLMGKVIQIGDAQLRVLRRTKRCSATEVNLATGERDLKVPYLLRKNLGHMDMGIYAEVINGGVIHPGDALRVVDR